MAASYHNESTGKRGSAFHRSSPPQAARHLTRRLYLPLEGEVGPRQRAGRGDGLSAFAARCHPTRIAYGDPTLPLIGANLRCAVPQ